MPCSTFTRACYDSHHVPKEVGAPVNEGTDATDELQMFGFAHSFLDQVEDKTCRDEGHGKDHTDRDNCIYRGGKSERETKRQKGDRKTRRMRDKYRHTQERQKFQRVK